MAKILLVEDDNNLREVYEDRLLAEGYDIVSARDGEEALTVAMKERPDLIISDVMMPKISGFDMLDIIRSTEETKNVKVIMMTALSQAEDKDRAARLGADRYLVKSQVTLEDVAKAARDVLAGTDSSGSETTMPGPAPAPVAGPAPAPVSDPALQAVLPQPDPAVNLTPQPLIASASQDPNTSAVASPLPATSDNGSSDQGANDLVDPVSAQTPQPLLSTTPAENTEVPTPESIPQTDYLPEPLPNQIDPLAAVQLPQSSVELSEEESAVVSSNPSSIVDEQSAIAKQIEDFIDSKKVVTPESVSAEEEAQIASPTIVTADPTAPNQPVVGSPAASKRIIQPLEGQGEEKPDLESLLKKEEVRDQMSEIAKNVAAGQLDQSDEKNAQSVLSNAAIQTQANPDVPVQDNPQDLVITDDGQPLGATVTANQEEQPTFDTSALDSTVQPAVTPEDFSSESIQPTPAQTEQVIPHTNGNSIDGITSSQPNIVQPTIPKQPEQPASNSNPAIDPNSIAL